MDYFEEGKKAKKTFARLTIHSRDDFQETVIEGILEDGNEHNASDFLRGMLDKTTNRVLFSFADVVADHCNNHTNVWGTILKALQFPVKTKKPSWLFEYLLGIFEFNDLNIEKRDIKILIYILVNYEDGSNVSWWLDKIKEKSWFKGNLDRFKSELLENSDKIIETEVYRIFRMESFRDLKFWRKFVDKTKSKKIFQNMMMFMRQHQMSLVTRIDVNEILYDYKEYFYEDERSIELICTIIASGYSMPGTGTLLLDMLNDSGMADVFLIKMLKPLDNIESEKITSKLYDLTGEEQYLPEDAKDIFLF